MRRSLARVLLLAMLLAGALSFGAGTLLDKLTPSDGAPGDGFGCAVAIDDRTLVIGSVDDDAGGLVNAGSVSARRRSSAALSPDS